MSFVHVVAGGEEDASFLCGDFKVVEILREEMAIAFYEVGVVTSEVSDNVICRY